MDDLLKRTLETAKAEFPPAPKVVDLRYRVGTDATGDGAVWVWVVLDDATPTAQLRHARFQPIADQIRAAIKKALREGAQFSLDLIPYVRFRLKSEQDEVDRAGAA